MLGRTGVTNLSGLDVASTFRALDTGTPSRAMITSCVGAVIPAWSAHVGVWHAGGPDSVAAIPGAHLGVTTLLIRG